GPDRGRPEAAGPDAATGADPDRPDGGDAVLLAVGRDHGRRRDHDASGRLQRQHFERASRQHGQPYLYGWGRYATPDFDRQCDRSEGVAAAEQCERESASGRRELLLHDALARDPTADGAGPERP